MCWALAARSCTRAPSSWALASARSSCAASAVGASSAFSAALAARSRAAAARSIAACSRCRPWSARRWLSTSAILPIGTPGHTRYGSFVATGTDTGHAQDGQGDIARIGLFEADPELLQHVATEEAERARRSLSAPLVVLPAGPFEPAAVFAVGTRPFAALITAGLVTRELTLGGQPTLLLLGPGDLLNDWELSEGLLSAEQAWAASGPVRLAVLDDRFLQAVRTWPRILTGLIERAAERHDSTLVQMAISQQPRVEDRLVALFRHLAERWGRVTPDGIVVALSLTHEALGRIIGARRPTVTLALKALAEEDRLHRRRDGSWVLLDAELTDTPPLTALKGAARPALVAGAEAPARSHQVDNTSVLDELHWLREMQGELRDRLEDLGERSEANCRHSQKLIHLGSARRGGSSAPRSADRRA